MTSASSSSLSWSSLSIDSNDDPPPYIIRPYKDPKPRPDVLGIYTGPPADIVLARSHCRWEQAVIAAENAAPGTLPPHVFNLEALLQSTPALPASIPPELEELEGYSIWKNADLRCPLRTKKEMNPRVPHGFDLRFSQPITLSISTSSDFQTWDGTNNNGIALLICGWAYILSSTLAESQGLPLKFVQVKNITSPAPTSSVPAPLDLSYTRPEEFEWWRTLVTPGTSISMEYLQDEWFSPWSLVVDDLGGLELIGRSAQPTSPQLPSARQAAEYLARFCRAYILGNQCSAALAAVLCFRISDKSRILVPKPRFFQFQWPEPTESGPSSNVPPDFKYVRYYITLSLSYYALPVMLESILWDPNVSCNHAGNLIWPIRTILGPIITAGDRELLAKTIASASPKVSPLWLGLLICGDYPNFLRIMDWLHWSTRTTLDVAAWTGVSLSFLYDQPTGPHFQNGRATRANVWRLRRDLNDNYEDDDYTLEPNGPFCPFGSMKLKDIEFELHGHLLCCHRWIYQHWTWLHNSATDIGFRPASSQIQPDVDTRQRFPGLDIMQCVRRYGSPADLAAIRRISLAATEWAFKWSGDQVERGFTGHVVPPCHFSEAIPLSEESEESEDGSSASASTDPVQKWLDALPTSDRVRRNPEWLSSYSEAPKRDAKTPSSHTDSTDSILD